MKKKPKRKGLVIMPEFAEAFSKGIEAKHRASHKMLVRPRVPSDDLPGETVRLPPMQWPEWLPVEVPANKEENGKYYLASYVFGDNAEVWSMVREVFYAVAGAFYLDLPKLQSAWSETLVRLGYTADWTDEDERRWEAKR